MFNKNPDSRLNVAIKGTFAGIAITGAVIGPITANNTRWVSVFAKRGGCFGMGQLTEGGEFIQDGNDPDNLQCAQAVIKAAVQQHQ